MTIGASTRLLALLGQPVAGSLSPRMQNAAFAARGLDWAYVPVDLGPEALTDAVRGLAAAALREAIVRSTRPNAPGLAVSSARVGGRRVTKVVYASGATLYLYPHRDVVYYVGTQNETLAAGVLQRLG